MKTTLLFTTIVTLIAVAAQAQNEDVTWQAPATVSGAADVSTEGTYVGSWAPYDGNATTLPVNGVTFQGNSDLTGLSASFPQSDQSGYGGFGNPGTPNSNYNTLLQTAAYAGSGSGTIVITWNDIPGHTYLIQAWANDGRGLFPGRTETFTGGANTSANLDFGDAPGQYIIGTYVADSSGSETITLSGAASTNGDYPQINLLQIRDITQASIAWQVPAAISGTSDVSTQGTYFGSWAPYASSSLTVNGVTFQNSTDLPGFSYTGFNAGYTAFPNPGTADNNYNTLLESGAYEYPGPACSFSWNGMTPGHTYLVQFWVNGSDSSRTETLTGGANTSAAINYDPGQYIIGTFVADGSGQETITLNGNPSDNYPQVNLVQVRDISVTTFTNYQSAVLTDNPLGYWPLDLTDPNAASGIATDLSGNGNNGSYYNVSPSGNLVAGPAPYITNAASFNTAQVYLGSGNNPDLLNFTGPSTLEAWAQPASLTPANLGDIIAKGYDGNANDQEIALRQNTSGNPFYGYFGTGGLSGGLQNTNWVYLVLANDGVNDYLYINGTLVASTPDERGSILFVDDVPWAIGNGTISGNSRTFDGNICQVAIYNYGLTAAQVLKHYYAAELNASPAASRPIITLQPQPQAGYIDGSVTFSVTAVSALPTTNQWFEGGVPLAGQTNATLTLNNLQPGSAGSYSVVVGNANGTTNSIAAALTVSTPAYVQWSANGNNGTWDVDTTANWIDLSNDTQTVFNQGDAALFDDTVGVPTTVSVSGTVEPSLITVNSSTNNFSISSGAISGSGSLIKEGSSVLSITSSGNFTGSATISGGAVYAGNNCLNSVSLITITNNSTLDLAGGTFSGNKPVTVFGTGLNGEGAIYNSYDDYPAEALNITLAGDTRFGGSARWDLASGTEINGPHNLTVDMSADANDNFYSQWNTLTLGNNVSGVIVTNGSGNSANRSVLGMSYMDASCQNPGTLFTVATNCQMIFYSGGFNGSIHVLNGGVVYIYSGNVAFKGSNLIFENGASWQTFYNSGVNPVSSAVTLNGVAHFVLGDHEMAYTNVISGSGGFVLDYYDNEMVLSASNTYSGPTVIGSSGNSPEVALSGNGSISHSSLIFFGGSDPTVAHIDATGRPDQTLTLANGQTLQGAGGIDGSLDVSSGAVVAPGGTNTTIGITTGSNPVGTIAASDNIALNGTTVIKLDGTSNDLVEAAADITYGGILDLVNISGSALAPGNSFQIFSAANYSGSFAGIVPASPGAGLAWNTNQLSSGMISVVASGAGPVIASTRISGGNLIFSGSGGTLNGTYNVLTSTNLTAPLADWTPIATNSFDSSGDFSVTNMFVPGVLKQFFIIKQP